MYGLSNGENIFDSMWPLKVKDQGQTLKALKPNISKTVPDWKSKEVRESDVWAFEWQKYFDLRWILKVYCQGQTLKALKSNIFKTVQLGGKMSIEDR